MILFFLLLNVIEYKCKEFGLNVKLFFIVFVMIVWFFGMVCLL